MAKRRTKPLPPGVKVVEGPPPETTLNHERLARRLKDEGHRVDDQKFEEDPMVWLEERRQQGVDAEGGWQARRAREQQAAKEQERIERLEDILVSAIKKLVHEQPREYGRWRGGKFLRTRACTWLMKNPPPEALPLLKKRRGSRSAKRGSARRAAKKKGDSDLRIVLNHTRELADWTKAQFEAERPAFFAKQAESQKDRDRKAFWAEKASQVKSPISGVVHHL
jgi:hypothetical protein